MDRQKNRRQNLGSRGENRTSGSGLNRRHSSVGHNGNGRHKAVVTTANSTPVTVVTSSSASMVVYVLCVLLILHAFTQDAVIAQACKDRNVKSCAVHMKRGHCDMANYKDLMKVNCPLSCKFCSPTE